MLFTDYLYENSKEVWDKYIEHPFLIELGEGTLDKEKFRKYLIQDYLYLIEYAKVYAMACVKSRNMKELKKFHNGVAGSIETETANHIMYLKDFGENIENMEFKYKLNMTNESYTSYMKSISVTGTIEEIVAAVLPCTWSYNYIGLKLKEKYKDKLEGNFFESWIETYASDEYVAFKNEWLDFTNELCENLPQDTKEKLKDIFLRASKYELEFWNMAYKGE